MKLTHKNAVEIFKRGGAIASSDWRYKGPIDNSRPIPKHCSKIRTKMLGTFHATGRLHNTVVETSRTIMQSRPKVRTLIVVHDWDAVQALAVQAKLS
jgi:hypothetical protein